MHFSIENDKNEATGTEIIFDLCHNYLKVGRVPQLLQLCHKCLCHNLVGWVGDN